MEKKDYANFIGHSLYDMDFRRIMMTDLYDTKNYLNTEYFSLFTTANCQIYYLFKDFSLDRKLEFYLYLDMLTYLPFEKLGYAYLNQKLTKENNNMIDFKYNKILKLLTAADITINEELKNEIRFFLNNYFNDEVEINIIGLAIITLRLFHRYVTMMNFGLPVGGSMGIHKKIRKTLDQITNDVNTNGLKIININNYLPEFDYSDELSEDMIKYLEYCLEREVK